MMVRSQQRRFAPHLLLAAIIVGSLAACSEVAPATTALAGARAPGDFDFATSKLVVLRLDAGDHGLTGELLYVKVALDAGFRQQLYLGRLNADGGLQVSLSVPVATRTLHYMVYGVGARYVGSTAVAS